jgi:Ca-activated chloride channel family protein
MRLLSKILLASVIVFIPIALYLKPVAAQEPSEPPTFRSDARLVLLYASVVDKKGQIVTGLPKEAFKVYEDNVEQPIKLFRQEDVPVSLGIVVDNSGSMRDKRKRVEAASVNLVKSSNPQDEVFIVNFNEDAYLDVPFTSDVKKMEEGLSRLDSRGGTAMRDALAMSIDHIKDKGKKDKKVLLVVTDGDDTASSDTNTLEKTLVKAQRSEVLIFAIGLLNGENPREAKRAKRALDSLTLQSGGLAHYPKTLEEVEAIATQIAHELRNQYIIAYTPNKPDDDSFRKIRVSAKGPGNPQVRTRTGYYASANGRRGLVAR